MISESKRKLKEDLFYMGWAVIEQNGKLWTIESTSGNEAIIKVRSHKDGSTASYEIVHLTIA